MKAKINNRDFVNKFSSEVDFKTITAKSVFISISKPKKNFYLRYKGS